MDEILAILRNAETKGNRVVERNKTVFKGVEPSPKSAFSPGRLDTV